MFISHAHQNRDSNSLRLWSYHGTPDVCLCHPGEHVLSNQVDGWMNARMHVRLSRT